ncbi:MAG: DUF354 domain-containing protein [Thermoplasmata archaeon]
MKKKLWFDIVNSSQALFFRPIVDELKDDHKVVITTRDLAETNNLVKKYGLEYKCFGQHWDKRKSFIIMVLLTRPIRLYPYVKNYDFAFSHGSVAPIPLRKIFRNKLISSYDNEHADSFKLLAKHSDYFLVPKILKNEANKYSSKNTKIFTFDGVKEQVYLADFQPDRDEISRVPFQNYILVRPEAWRSDYVDIENILAYKLTKELIKNNHNVVYLPRYGKYPSWMKDDKKIYIPSKTLDGTQLCWFSDGVLTGSGTLAREAGVLGLPAISFYPSKPLKVDIWLSKNGYIRRSRDFSDIIKYLKTAEKNPGLLKDAKNVKDDFFRTIKDIIE